MKRVCNIVWMSLLSYVTVAQNTVPQGWHTKDLKTDGYYGISLDKAYEFVKSKNLTSKPVIVGIVDSGIDTTHEDLKPVLWTNPGEIPGNSIDDDKNGYIDDVHGWNFLGSRDGRENVEKDSYEAARIYWKYKDQFESKTAADIATADKAMYETWLRSKQDIMKNASGEQDVSYSQLVQVSDLFRRGDAIIKKDLKKDVYTCKDLQSYSTSSMLAGRMRDAMLATCGGNNTDDITNKELLDMVQKDIDKMDITQKPPKNYRDDVVKDNYADFNDKYYGNNNIYVSNDGAMHGTHVAGIIGAVRNNGVGMNGIADNVKILMVRAVPDGDEHDKDIALGIRYAVDNGARVINMSFGKGFSPEKKWVDDAVKYAVSKNVLLVHAAGNDAQNNDSSFNFPSAHYLDGNKPATWVTVGASGDEKAGGLTASFSNYGKKEVDVFAPGVRIYSTVPGGNTYANLQGTSMASPVVAGLAAFILEYYPNLTAVQLKNIIEKSVSKPTTKVNIPGKEDTVWLSDISVTGGIVNAYEAIKLASLIKSSSPKKSAVKKTVKKK